MASEILIYSDWIYLAAIFLSNVVPYNTKKTPKQTGWAGDALSTLLLRRYVLVFILPDSYLLYYELANR